MCSIVVARESTDFVKGTGMRLCSDFLHDYLVQIEVREYNNSDAISMCAKVFWFCFLGWF